MTPMLAVPTPAAEVVNSGDAHLPSLGFEQHLSRDIASKQHPGPSREHRAAAQQ